MTSADERYFARRARVRSFLAFPSPKAAPSRSEDYPRATADFSNGFLSVRGLSSRSHIALRPGNRIVRGLTYRAYRGHYLRGIAPRPKKIAFRERVKKFRESFETRARPAIPAFAARSMQEVDRRIHAGGIAYLLSTELAEKNREEPPRSARWYVLLSCRDCEQSVGRRAK